MAFRPRNRSIDLSGPLCLIFLHAALGNVPQRSLLALSLGSVSLRQTMATGVGLAVPEVAPLRLDVHDTAGIKASLRCASRRV